MKKRIITISREFGSGGRSIGRMVAEKLGYQFYDQELILDVAKESGLAKEVVACLLYTSLFAPEVKYRLVEEYGPDSFTAQPDGRLLFTRGFQYPEDAAAWFLAFGDRAEVLSPLELREALRKTAQNILERYS